MTAQPKRASLPLLKPGEEVRLSPDGPLYTVARVNTCAAYLRRGVPRQVTVTDRATGELRTFEVVGQETVAVSPRAAVYRQAEQAKGDEQ